MIKTIHFVVLFAFLVSRICMAEEVNDKPWTENWSPSIHGADDRRGSLNYINQASVLRAMTLVKEGKTATLGKVYERSMPLVGNRNWKLMVPGRPTEGPFGDNQILYNIDYLCTEIAQVGTQIDGPAHIGVRTSRGDYYYNANMGDEIYDSSGFKEIGVENLGETGIVTRGILLDATAYRNLERLPIPSGKKNDPGVITSIDIRNMLARQQIAPIQAGDAVFLYTGHGDLWGGPDWDEMSDVAKEKNRQLFNSGEPGYDMSACEYLQESKVSIWGSDTAASEAMPDLVNIRMESEVSDLFPCHVYMLTQYGVWNMENLDFSQLLADGVYEFVFAWSPLKIKGATGSPGNPIAIY